MTSDNAFYNLSRVFVNKLNENRYKNCLNIAKFTLGKNLVLIFTNIIQVSKNTILFHKGVVFDIGYKMTDLVLYGGNRKKKGTLGKYIRHIYDIVMEPEKGRTRLSGLVSASGA